MKLSKNFEISEFTKSDIADYLGIKLVATPEQVKCLIDLCENVLQPAREYIGNISINSGIRNDALNKAIGGAKGSQHLKGQAADIRCNDNKKLFLWIKDNLTFDQVIYEMGNDTQPNWIHVSYNANHNRKEVLKAIKDNGKTVYLKWI